MDLSKLSKREQILIFATFFAVATAIFYQFLFEPQLKSLNKKRESIGELKNLFSQVINSKSFDEELKSLITNPLYRKLQNKQADHSAFLLSFFDQEKLSQNFQISSFNPQKFNNFKNYKRFPYDLKIRTSYQGFYTFINLFNELPALALIDRLSIQRDEERPSYLMIDMNISFYEAI